MCRTKLTHRVCGTVIVKPSSGPLSCKCEQFTITKTVDDEPRCEKCFKLFQQHLGRAAAHRFGHRLCLLQQLEFENDMEQYYAERRKHVEALNRKDRLERVMRFQEHNRKREAEGEKPMMESEYIKWEEEQEKKRKLKEKDSQEFVDILPVKGKASDNRCNRKFGIIIPNFMLHGRREELSGSEQ
ncbi:hypothetical protein ABW19_dt0201015 [Dactylella cylindrospora]|nr:hypothetical protein ABW19_dt0201015 [Dactylella cylindrospora]